MKAAAEVESDVPIEAANKKSLDLQKLTGKLSNTF
jgi:hypothetical protein